MTAALEGGEWSAACPGHIYPWERPGTHCKGGWVGPRAGLDVVSNTYVFKLSNILERVMLWNLHVARMCEEKGVYSVLVGKPEGKRPLGRPRRRWVDNIRMDFQEVGCGYMDWNGLAQDRDRWRTIVSAVMNLRVPWNAGNFLTICKPVRCSRRTLHHGIIK